VFSKWVSRYNEFGDVSVLDTPTFFFGMTPGEEIKVNIEQGKMLVIKLVHISEPDEKRYVHRLLRVQRSAP
jgi:pyruvate carboxylase